MNGSPLTSETSSHPLPSGLIHDLRTPLNLIIGYSEMLIEQAKEQAQEDFVPDLQKTLNAGRQLLGLINDNFHSVRGPNGFVNITTKSQEAATEAQAEYIPTGGPGPAPANGSLLVVDDIESNRDILSRRLMRQGYAVSTAENGRQALEMLRTGHFDLMLLDIMMPEMNGYEVLEYLKADEELRQIPVIMISALSELDSAVHCIEMGAEDYLLKPFNPTILRARIGACLGKKLALQTMRALETANQLLETSRQAGMAEVATSILHNVGNIFNSVNVSGSLILDKIQKSHLAGLTKVVGLMEAHQSDLPGFFEKDPKGQQLPGYLEKLAVNLAHEQKEIRLEVQTLLGNVIHIKEVIAVQQDYARVSGVIEELHVDELLENALRINKSALERNAIKLVRQYSEVGPVMLDKHKVLQILVNLVRNAKHAFDDSGEVENQIILRITKVNERLEISIADNGVGIPPENLIRIFSHGFTTKKDGHGFGLHSGALTAKELGGTLKAFSGGTGRGSKFTLELPMVEAKS